MKAKPHCFDAVSDPIRKEYSPQIGRFEGRFRFRSISSGDWNAGLNPTSFMATAFILMFTLSAGARTIYVRLPAHPPTGELANTDDGSLNRPYDSFSRALANAVLGDEIVAFPGTYKEGLNYQVQALKFRSQGSGIVRIEPPPEKTITLDGGFGARCAGNHAPEITAVSLDQPVDKCDSFENQFRIHADVMDEGVSNPPDVSVTWNANGPGSVDFSPNVGRTTSAKFSAPGTYHVTATATDKCPTQSLPKSFTVTIPALAESFLRTEPGGNCYNGGISYSWIILQNAHPTRAITFEVAVPEAQSPSVPLPPPTVRTFTKTLDPGTKWNAPCLSSVVPHSLRFADCAITKPQVSRLSIANASSSAAINNEGSFQEPTYPEKTSPWIVETKRLSDGSLEIDVRGSIGSTGRLEVSSDLVSWAVFKTILFEEPSVKIIDERAYNQDQRFYRVSTP